MADRKPSGLDSPPSPADDLKSGTIFDHDIGDDWGEAFQAESSPGGQPGAPAEIFLESDSFEESTSERVHGATATTADASSTEQGRGLNAARLLALASSLPGRFLGLSLPGKIAAGAVPALLVLILLFFSRSTEIPPPATRAVAPPEAAPALPQGQESTLPPSQAMSESDANRLLESLKHAPKEKVKAKWTLPSFIIPASSKADPGGVAMVSVDISFVLLLDSERDLPQDRALFVRDLIYQFYSNRPIEELQRFSLARGEMGNKLRSWIDKQWPENSIASIVFDRYQIL